MRLFGKVPVAAAEGHVGCDALLCEVDDDGDDGAGLFSTRGRKDIVSCWNGVRRARGGGGVEEGGTNLQPMRSTREVGR